MKSSVLALLRRAIEVEETELAALVWSFLYFFSILCAYFILRPLRDQLAIASGLEHLPWLFTATFAAMLCMVPLFGALVSRFPRRRLIPAAYGLFVLFLVAFWLLFAGGVATAQVARVFFVWLSVFNLFVVSVFWSFMVDTYREEQGRRLFGVIAAGGTAGTIAGPLLTVVLTAYVAPAHLLLISAALLGFAIVCVHRLLAASAAFQGQPADGAGEAREAAIGGGIFAGVTELLKSPYLMGLAVFIALFTWTSTFVYFQQAHIIAEAFETAAERTRVFATIDLSVSTLTILGQMFVTARFIRAFGVAAAVALLPAVSAAGFALFALAPTVAVLIVFQIVRRASNFAITRPGRELLFTVVGREQKYKSKNFIDTVVYRGGDAVSGWAFAGLGRGLGLELATIAGLCVPVAVAWMGLGWLLGREQSRRAEAAAVPEPRPAA